MKPTPHQAFTQVYNGLALQLRTHIQISQLDEPDNAKIIQVEGIWDTGATVSTITKVFASKLGLIPVGKIEVKGVHGVKVANVYMIDLILPNHVKFKAVSVAECEELTTDGNCAMLIGMDVISNGDLAISNAGGKTTFTFRIPPQSICDFVKDHNNHFNKPKGSKFTPPIKRGIHKRR